MKNLKHLGQMNEGRLFEVVLYLSVFTPSLQFYGQKISSIDVQSSTPIPLIQSSFN